MTFGEILRKIRIEEKDSYKKLGEKTGITYSYFDKIERGISPINAKILEALINVYPNRKEELIKAYCDSTIPSFVMSSITSEITRSDERISLTKNKIKIFTVLSNTDGLLLPDYEVEEMMTTVELNEKNNFAIRISGDEIPEFYDGDTVLVEKAETEMWQVLNQKIVVIQINGKDYIKKIIIKDYKPYFYSLNELYEPIDLEKNDVKLVGIISKLLYRNLDKIKF